MSIDTVHVPGETREMRLVSFRLGDKDALFTYLAERREPGKGWMTWEHIAYDLFERTGETFTRAGITNWAKAYGIPTTSRAGQNPAAYREAVAQARQGRPKT